MKYIEVSKKLALSSGNMDEEDIKQALLIRLRRAFRIDMLQEHPGGFHLSGTTGGKRGFIRNVRATIDVRIVNKKDGNIGIVIHGHALVAQSLMVAYTILFVMIMVVGLLPGFVETNESSTAADALVFLLFGIFIFYDIDNKLQDPARYIEAALASLEAEFG